MYSKPQTEKADHGISNASAVAGTSNTGTVHLDFIQPTKRQSAYFVWDRTRQTGSTEIQVLEVRSKPQLRRNSTLNEWIFGKVQLIEIWKFAEFGGDFATQCVVRNIKNVQKRILG